MEEEKGRNNKGIFPAAILFTVEISHVIPARHPCWNMYVPYVVHFRSGRGIQAL